MTKPSDWERSRRFYDADAEQYDRARFADSEGRSVNNRQRELICSALDGLQVARAVEVGCGSGRITELIVSRCQDLVIVDVSPKMLETTLERVASRDGATVVATQGSIYDIPLASDSCDCCVSINVLSHVQELKNAFLELTRVVRPGGHIVISIPNLWSIYLPAALVVNARRSAFAHDVYSCWYRSSQISKVARAAGCEVEAVTGMYFTPRAVKRVPGVARAVAFLDKREARSTSRARRGSSAPWLLITCRRAA